MAEELLKDLNSDEDDDDYRPDLNFESDKEGEDSRRVPDHATSRPCTRAEALMPQLTRIPSARWLQQAC